MIMIVICCPSNVVEPRVRVDAMTREMKRKSVNVVEACKKL